MTHTAAGIDWIHESDHYDVPLSGWVRSGGRYLWFELEHQGRGAARWAVYDIPRPLRLPHLRHVRAFRHAVGWHWDGRPGKGGGAGPKPGHMAFYDLPKPPAFVAKEVGLRVGTTADLATIDAAPQG